MRGRPSAAEIEAAKIYEQALRKYEDRVKKAMKKGGDIGEEVKAAQKEFDLAISKIGS